MIVTFAERMNVIFRDDNVHVIIHDNTKYNINETARMSSRFDNNMCRSSHYASSGWMIKMMLASTLQDDNTNVVIWLDD
jgi:hypothetical protein